MKKFCIKFIAVLYMLAALFSGCSAKREYIVKNPPATPIYPITTDIDALPTFTPVSKEEIRDYYVLENGTRLFSQPDNTSKITAVLSAGDKVKLLEINNSFYYVHFSDFYGYIDENTLTYSPVSPVQLPDINTWEFTSAQIIIIKSLHVLEIWDENKLILSCSADIGMNEDGPKEILGDKKTPEGEYYICMSSAGSKYHKALFLSYPNTQDAQNALDNGIININTYNQIASAVKNKETPPLKTPLGGYISIHGAPNEKGYTDGCIAVENDVMDILWDNFPTGSSVTILP